MFESPVTDSVGGGNTISNQTVRNDINSHFLSSKDLRESVPPCLFGVFFHQELTSASVYVCLRAVIKRLWNTRRIKLG